MFQNSASRAALDSQTTRSRAVLFGSSGDPWCGREASTFGDAVRLPTRLPALLSCSQSQFVRVLGPQLHSWSGPEMILGYVGLGLGVRGVGIRGTARFLWSADSSNAAITTIVDYRWNR